MPIYVPPLIALAGGLMLAMLPLRNRKSVCTLTELFMLATAVCTGFCLTGPDTVLKLLTVSDGLELCLKMDDLSRIFAGLISFLWPLASLYAFEYMKHEAREKTFFAFYTVTYAITLGIAFSGNLFTLYFFYEALSLITLPLVSHKQDEAGNRAGMTYMKYTIGGATLGLVGMIGLSQFGDLSLFVSGGTMDPARIAEQSDVFLILFLIAFVGFSVKAAIFPLHRWLPEASVAPTPVTALLHAVAVVNAGAFAVIRLIYYCVGTENITGTYAQTVTLILTAFTVAFGAVMAVREQHMKRRLAWSTVSNLNYILFSACLMTRDGVTGALAHMVFHGLIKITLFFCAGAYLVQSGKQYIRDLRGAYRSMPVVTVIFAIAGIALTGIPPFAGFLSKWEILSAAMSSGNSWAWCGIGAIILSSVLCSVYLLSPGVQLIFMPQSDAIRLRKPTDPGFLMKFTLIVLILIIIFACIFSVPLIDFFRHAVI